MEHSTIVLEYKCPCCNAGLVFGSENQQLTCEYCGNTFELEAVKAFNDQPKDYEEIFQWEANQSQGWNEEEQNAIHAFQCPSCGGELVTDEHTTASFCPFCDNPTILPSRLSGGLKPDSILPFQTKKEDAASAFLNLCKGKLLLPKGFTSEQRIEKITGIYVPFWLYDCEASFTGNYKATRIHTWSDSHYRYTKTDHFLLRRNAQAAFHGIPMDGSSKMEDTFMESIEPYDYQQMKPFDMAFLTGYFADKYDVPSDSGKDRIRQRVDQTFREELQSTLLGYATTMPTSQKIDITHSQAQYVLLPVWMLNTRYRDKIYTFAMNGQTGKMTGALPICPKKTAAWFAGIAAAVTLLASLIQIIL